MMAVLAVRSLVLDQAGTPARWLSESARVEVSMLHPRSSAFAHLWRRKAGRRRRGRSGPSNGRCGGHGVPAEGTRLTDRGSSGFRETKIGGGAELTSRAPPPTSGGAGAAPHADAVARRGSLAATATGWRRTAA